MATQNNFLKYSGLTYQEIMQQINDKLQADGRFDNFRESAVAKTLIEIFAGTVDIVNYYIDRRAEECYLDTAKLRSSVIMLARQLGYVVTRPVPPEAQIKIIASGPLTGAVAGDKIQIPFQRVFTYKGTKFIIKNGFTHTLSQSELDRLTSNGTVEWTTDDNNDYIEIVQGEIKEKVIEGSTNNQVGSRFQLYRLNDVDFSNRYGDQDFDVPVTRIWVGDDKNDNTEFSIDRRSLINWKSIEAANDSENNKVCVVRTSINEDIEILFGDAQFASLGANVSAANTPNTSYDNIYIQYLATEGSKKNQIGIISEKINYSDKIINRGVDLTSNFEFQFTTNITGGSDIEDIDSIKVNAPEIYYSLDRLVTKRDYIAYLKSLTSPINIKNALAWGEQEEIANSTSGTAILDMFNVVMFSVVGDLYNVNGNEDTDTFTVLTKETGLYNAILDTDYDEHVVVDNSYYNIYLTRDTGPYCNKNISKQLRNYTSVNTSAAYFVSIGQDVSNFTDEYDYIHITSGQTTANVDIAFTSIKSANAANIVGSVSAAIDLNFTAGVSTINDVATSIETALQSVNDNRNGSDSFGSTAFENTTVFWTVDNSLSPYGGYFTISGHPSDECHIIGLLDKSQGTFISNVGLDNFASSSFRYKTEQAEISKGILDLVTDLRTRSQITVRPVYITPTLQNFKLVGNVYLNQLYDKVEQQRKINNQIYKFLSKNADFNVDIYKSNIIQIIEDFPGVEYTNFDISASNDALPVGRSKWHWVGFNDTLDVMLPYWPTGIYNTSPDARLTGGENGTFDIISSQVSNYLDSTELVTERTFWEEFVTDTYNQLGLSVAGLALRDTQNFKNVIADIHKDFANTIKINMLDTNGDIVTYSIGSEIVKIESQLNYVYKS